ncbi:hypothetical protein TNCV_4934201 [Trichonephila clavipes]|nr:hypothetical protein TNCV_4934201 [Trichonephila clavipes]
MTVFSIRRHLLLRGLSAMIFMANHRRLNLQWDDEHRDKQVDFGTKLASQMVHDSICETMMAAFVLDAMPVNPASQSALSNCIVP